MFDYVSSITIGSIAGEMAVLSTDSFFKPLMSMAIFSILALLISYLTCKSIILRKFFGGQTLLLYQDGQIYEKNLLSAKIDMDEFLSAVRVSGYYDLKEVHSVYLESNGKISVLPNSKFRPVTPQDLNLSPLQSVPLPNIIIDGNIIKKTLTAIGKNEAWLNKQLKLHGLKGLEDIDEIMLATYDSNEDSLSIYIKLHKKMDMNIFE
jgi:uncharacterized membrane protein YcaP (DUF421 family)